jgi:hypothetical protein
MAVNSLSLLRQPLLVLALGIFFYSVLSVADRLSPAGHISELSTGQIEERLQVGVP